MMSCKGSLSESLGKSNLVGYLISYVIFPFVAKYTIPEGQPVPLHAKSLFPIQPFSAYWAVPIRMEVT